MDEQVNNIVKDILMSPNTSLSLLSFDDLKSLISNLYSQDVLKCKYKLNRKFKII